ncbi:hypothetical protein BSZ19_02525 [Bradyrhizobium japonicum]|uniref:Uncharacterized protein n=2 Tax=Bradyrhizobium TaxID=374 RepID=A0A1Y2JX82_BRAJP|nr:hypothetical protein BSZ19_02525 [Bradyrhizobium japonicum]
MFRDVFARTSIPLGFGKISLDPFTLTDLTKNQLGWLAMRPRDIKCFLDQFTDIMDFSGGSEILATTSFRLRRHLSGFGWLHSSSRL